MGLLMLLSLVNAAKADSLLVISSPQDGYRQVAGSIATRLDTPTKTVTLQQLENQSFNTLGFEQIITIGFRATDALFDKVPVDKKIYASYLPKRSFLALLDKYRNHPRTQKRTITAVFLDQPYRRQVAFARIILPQAKIIATALGPNSKHDLGLLEKASEAADFTLKHEQLDSTDNPILKLQPLISTADLFLSLPDKSVFNRVTTKWILYISFRKRIPLIGFTKRYVDAGALAAVFSTSEQIGQQTAELIQTTAGKKRLPPGHYPVYYSVATNQTAARSLRIKIPSEEHLKAALLSYEHQKPK